MQQLDLTTILASVRRLDSLLTEEFEALKNQKLDVFEALQTEKIDILESLVKLNLSEEKMEKETLERLINDQTWNEITSILERCKRSHQSPTKYTYNPTFEHSLWNPFPRAYIWSGTLISYLLHPTHQWMHFFLAGQR